MPLKNCHSDSKTDEGIDLAKTKEQTKPNNLAETGAEAEVSASAIGSKRVVCKYSVPVKPKPN